MDDANLTRMFELIQLEFTRSRAEMNEFRAEVNARFAEVATRGELNAVRGEVNGLRGEVSDLRAEMNTRFDRVHLEMAERFESVVDRLDLVERKVAKITPVVEEMRAELNAVNLNAFKFDNRFDGLQMSLNSLADDMRQRFRGLNERLSSV